MSLSSQCFCYLVFTLILQSNTTILRRNDFAEEILRVRVRRQDGYVYDKPSVSFDLPSQSTTESTQAPTVDRTLTQQMFYAYPAPAGGDTINIGNAASTTTSPAAPTSASGGATGYNYRATTTAKAGYSYGTSGTKVTQTNTASQVTNTASQSTITGSQSVTNTGSAQTGSGYGYKAPSPTLSSSLQESSAVSTSAPKYLPPGTGATDSSGNGGTVNIGSGSVSSGGGQVTTSTSTATQIGSTSIGTPSDTYLPPLNTNTAISAGQTLSTITDTQKNVGGLISVPSTAYLPPKSSPSPVSVPTTTSQSAAPAGGYIPPSNTGSSSSTSTSSTSASRYLPPGFF